MQDSSQVAIRKLDCFNYYLLGEQIGISTHDEAIKRLESWGFNVSPTYKKCKNIAEVLEMTSREAFAFFRGQPKVQAKLKP